MNDKRFFDTNLRVYLYSQDEPDKQSIAKNFGNEERIPERSIILVDELLVR